VQEIKVINVNVMVEASGAMNQNVNQVQKEKMENANDTEGVSDVLNLDAKQVLEKNLINV
jgi:hypothetical protein